MPRQHINMQNYFLVATLQKSDFWHTGIMEMHEGRRSGGVLYRFSLRRGTNDFEDLAC